MFAPKQGEEEPRGDPQRPTEADRVSSSGIQGVVGGRGLGVACGHGPKLWELSFPTVYTLTLSREKSLIIGAPGSGWDHNFYEHAEWITPTNLYETEF